MFLQQWAEQLRPHYSEFFSEKDNIIPLTGHSHQFWPNIARDAYLESWDNSKSNVDHKWDIVFQKQSDLKKYLKTYYQDSNGLYSFDSNTHALIIRFLSALDLDADSEVLTTDYEFYTLSRQLKLLEKLKIKVKFINESYTNLSDKIISSIHSKTKAVMLSRVFFETSLLLQNVSAINKKCREYGVPLLVDDYHGCHVIPLSLQREDLEDIFIVGGGYKYLQWGEGNAYLRFPVDCQLKPLISGWFANYSSLDNMKSQKEVAYSDDDFRFAGATFDGTSAFRASKVAHFFTQRQLDRETLRKIYYEQLSIIKNTFSNLDLNPDFIKLSHEESLEFNGGFLSFQCPQAAQLTKKLWQVGVWTDCRGPYIRFGPAPYLFPSELQEAMERLKEVVETNFD